MDSELAVFIILGVAIAAVCIHLILYSKRQARLMRRFAASEGYSYQQLDDGTLARSLDETFGIAEQGYVRTFERVRDIVAIPNGEIFRTIELLDLNPHASAENPHRARVGVRFSGLPEWNGIFHITPALDVHQRYPIGNKSVAGQIRQYVVETKLAKPPYPLSLTVVDGQALAYLEPTVVGSLAPSTLIYLADFAAHFSHQQGAKSL